MPHRPGFGTKGRPVVLWTNYFNMTFLGSLHLNRYSFEISGDQDGRSPVGKKLKRIVQLFLEEHMAQYGHDIVTDFKSNILSKAELDLNKTSYAVTYRMEKEDSPSTNAKTYKIKLQSTGTITVSELMDYLTSTQAGKLLGSKEEMIQALNILVGHQPKAASDIASVGANRHFRPAATPTERFDLGAGLTALRGFFVSVRAATARILVNVQVKNGAFYQDGPLDTLMHAFMSQNGQSKVRLCDFTKKLSVDVTHIVKTNKAGTRVPRIKAIMGFAMRDDGRELQHPPIVSEFGAGSKEVKFFLTSPSLKPSETAPGPSGTTGKRKKGKAPVSGPSNVSQGRYISVYDFFKQSKSSVIIRDCSISNYASVQHYYQRATASSGQRGFTTEPQLLTAPSLHGTSWPTIQFEAEPFSNATNDTLCSPQTYSKRPVDRNIWCEDAGI